MQNGGIDFFPRNFEHCQNRLSNKIQNSDILQFTGYEL